MTQTCSLALQPATEDDLPFLLTLRKTTIRNTC
ncbi:GNAT family N-acetyltransferase, partial [Achromobacter xylosoxidans]